MTTNKQLRELAEKATPGPWGWDGTVWEYDAENEAPWLIQEQGGGVVITGELQCSEANAEYIAAASPEVIMALLAEIDSLKTERGALVEALEAISRNELDAQRAQHIAAVALAAYRNQGRDE